MPKKSLSEQLKQTAKAQKQENKDRFSKADSVLLKKASGKTEPAKKQKPKTENQSNQKLIRDGFLIPENDHKIIQETQKRLASSGTMTSKTEVIRIALRALEKLSDKRLSAFFRELESIKKGRPKD